MALTELQQTIVSYIDKKFEGELPSSIDIWLALGKQGIPCSKEYIEEEFWASKEVREALAERGLPTSRLPQDQLTPEQVLALNVLLDVEDTRPIRRKLNDMGITTYKYNAWLRNRTFRDYFNSRAEGMLDSRGGDAHLALVRQVQKGDIGAIKYFNHMTGRFDPNAAANVNVPALLTQVFNIIQRHILDHGVLSAIGQDLLALTSNGVLPLQDSPVARTSIKPAELEAQDNNALLIQSLSGGM